MLFSKRLRPRPQLVTPLQTTIRTRKSDLQRELFPLHSPLLGESWLVSFPPLSYMLKFSGSSCLIGGPNESWKRPRTANRNYDSTHRARTRACRIVEVVTRRRLPQAAEATTTTTTTRHAVNNPARRPSLRWHDGSFVHEVRCTRSASSGTRRVRRQPTTTTTKLEK